MSSMNQTGMAEKIEDLTESLNRTSDVLSTADRMIDHYRNLNTEQEFVISKLKEDLKRSNGGNKQNDLDEYLLSGRGESKFDANRKQERLSGKSLRDSKRKIDDESSSDLCDDYEIRSIPQRKKSSYSPRVRFKDVDTRSTPDYEMELLKSSMSEFERKQVSLEAGLRKNQQTHAEEIHRLDSSIRKQLSFDLNEDKSFEISNNLKKLQQQLEQDHIEYSKQQQEVQSITKEMKSLKDVLQEATIPKKSEPVSTHMLGLDKKLSAYKRKVNKQEDTIKILKEQLENKKDEANTCESTVYKMQSLEKLKSEQLKLLEQQFNDEKNEKLSILKEFEDTQRKLSEANKERAELLYHLSDVKSEAQASKLAYEQSSNKVPQIKSLLEECGKQRDKLSDQVDHLNNELLSNNNLILKLKSQIDDDTANIKSLEIANEKLSQQIENAALKDHDITRELQSTKEMLSESKKKCETLEASKKDLKEKALKTLREYRCKYKKCEKQIQNQVEQLKSKEVELSKAVSISNDQEIMNLKQKKELQELSDDVDTLQQRIVESENMRNQLAFEKCQLEDALSKVNDQSQLNYELQREINELKIHSQNLTSQIGEEKSKRKDAQSLLQEYMNKNATPKEDTAALTKQLEESNEKLLAEQQERSKELLNVKKEYKSILKEKEIKINELKLENEQLGKSLISSADNLKKISEEYEYSKKLLEKQETATTEQMEKVKAVTLKLRKLAEENKKIRKQLHDVKDEYGEKLKNAQIHASQIANKEQSVLVARENNRVNTIEPSIPEAKDDGIAKVFTILLQDSENLLCLLSHEEENAPTIKVVPHNVLPEYRRAILEIREKYQTSYSITKTLKGRFQQQKSLIKRAQEKIKSQIEQIRILSENRHDESHNAEKIATLEVLRKSDIEKINFIESLRKKDQEKIESLEKIRQNDLEKVLSLEALRASEQKILDRHKECEEKIASLEDSKKKDLNSILKKDSELVDLKRRVSELTRDLEGCTRALHKSIEVDKERKSVLNEIDLLKSEHKERQKIDEDYFRCTEKIELLTEQLTEAKNSLNEIKQDSIDRSATTNRLINTFGSVSPSRKRRLFLYDSPICKTTKNVEEGDSILASPTHDTDDFKNTHYRHNDTLEDILLHKAGAMPKL